MICRLPSLVFIVFSASWIVVKFPEPFFATIKSGLFGLIDAAKARKSKGIIILWGKLILAERENY